MKWEVKHDIAKKVIDHFLDNAGYWQESEIFTEGLSEEEKNIVSEEIELMITSIRKRYKLQERLPQNSEEKPIKTEIQEVVKKPETVVVPEQQEDKPKPKRIRKTSDTEKKTATRKPRAKKVKSEE
ncbi:MAG: hypothetical protein ACLSUP_02770 [Blautia massiliensis (ex Durand et al. 2017)]|uniref:hypothetical protein n=1 Tax=Blautia massiliensis (ex Durand et al. 2017) TaxID=1737424 RepID=UPI003993C3E8